MSAYCRLALGLMIVSAWLAAGCSSAKKIEAGGACTLNSDCSQGLVCTWGKCHVACHTSADCQPGQSCIVVSDQSTVCESHTACVYNSDCPSGLMCAVDQQCRKQCQTDIDCTSGQVCTSSKSCADTTDLINGLLPPKGGSGAPDAGPGGGAAADLGAGGNSGAGDARGADTAGVGPLDGAPDLASPARADSAQAQDIPFDGIGGPLDLSSGESAPVPCGAPGMACCSSDTCYAGGCCWAGSGDGGAGRCVAAGAACGAYGGICTAGTCSAGTTGVPSAGCGKSATLYDGVQKITVSGTTRTYSLQIPANYDSVHTYPLVLSPSSAPAPTPDGSTIYVSYDGNATEKTFIDSIVKQIEDNLCVDTSRVQLL